MRSTVYFFPLRTSVTDSVGISTLPILFSRANARTRDSSDSFTLRSNPEYEWMMYHFMLGLRGGSATAAGALSGAPGATASVLLLSLLGSSGICLKILYVTALLREKTVQAVQHVIDAEEIQAKNEDGNQHHRGRRPHFLPRGGSDLAHLGAHVVVKRLDAVRPGHDSVIVACGCCARTRHFLRLNSHTSSALLTALVPAFTPKFW